MCFTSAYVIYEWYLFTTWGCFFSINWEILRLFMSFSISMHWSSWGFSRERHFRISRKKGEIIMEKLFYCINFLAKTCMLLAIATLCSKSEVMLTIILKIMFSKKSTKFTKSSQSIWCLLSKCQIEDFVILGGLLRKHEL